MDTYFRVFLGSVASSAVVTRVFPQYAPTASYVLNFLGIFVVLASSLVTWRVILYPLYLSPLRHLPEPDGGSFFMGQMPRIMKEPTGDPMRGWIEEVPNEGLIRYKHAFNAERLLPTSPKALAEVLVTKNYDFVKPGQIRHGLGRLLGVGILLAEGDEHKRQRKLLIPAFSYRHIKDLYPTFWSKSQEVVEAMAVTISQKSENGEKGTVMDVGSWASRVTLDIIGVAGMGHDFGAIKDPDSELNKCYRAIFNIGGGPRLLQLLQLFVPLRILAMLPSKRNQEVIAARRLIRRVCFELIEEKRANMEKGGRTDKDILSVAIESGGFSDEDLVNQLMTFLAAGHETTASAMVWASYLLCSYPDVQKRLREEIREKLPSIADRNATVSAADVDKLLYLNAVCNETLRFLPSVPMTLRIASKNTSIIGNYVPKGTPVIISPWAINVSKELWGEDARSFNPERWMAPGCANTGGADSNYSFLTFLHGPRSCIGQNFAKAEFACLLAAFIGKFDMEFETKDYVLTVAGGVTSRPKGGLKVKMTPIDGW